jgi:hypothetical protein
VSDEVHAQRVRDKIAELKAAIRDAERAGLTVVLSSYGTTTFVQALGACIARGL